MQLNPYLNFSGQCEAAFKFYEQCLRATTIRPRHEQSERDNAHASVALYHHGLLSSP